MRNLAVVLPPAALIDGIPSFSATPPGIYLPEFGVRLEVDVYIDGAGKVHVTGGELQTEVLAVMGKY